MFTGPTCGVMLAVVQVSCPVETKVTPVAATPPTVTVAPLRNAEPVMVMSVPPACGPPAGATASGLGGGTTGAAGVDDELFVQPAAIATARPHTTAVNTVPIRGAPMGPPDGARRVPRGVASGND
jgi:hypothetical protein